MPKLLIVAAAVALACSGLATGAGAAAQKGCPDFHFPIYFQHGSSRLGHSQAGAIKENLGRARACRVTGIDVTAGRDAGTSGAEADKLAQDRASVVAEALRRSGVAPEQIHAAVSAPSASQDIMQRHADVLVHLAAP